MATRFEFLLYGETESRMRAAAEEAFHEIERLEAQLSLYRSSSEVFHLNRRAGSQPFRVEPGLFRLLQRAQRLTCDSLGAFDVTIAPLVRCWGFMGGGGQLPDPEAISTARAQVGIAAVQFDEERFTVQFLKPGLTVDLGAIGKGYALEKAAEILREDGVNSALLHGGTSTVTAIGAPPDASFWKIAIPRPRSRGHGGGGELETSQKGSAVEVLTEIALRDESLSVSETTGKYFVADGVTYGHVLDPRSGTPVQGACLAAVCLPLAAETDALSTALLVLGKGGIEVLKPAHPELRAVVVGVEPQTQALWREAVGIEV